MKPIKQPSKPERSPRIKIMKTNELRIGNYVSFHNVWYKIVGIEKERVLIEYHNGETDYCWIDYIDPIELTEEVLFKIGFKKERKLISILFYLDYEINDDEYIRVKYLIYNSKTLPLLRIASPSASIYESHELTKRGIKYIHELQNAYYCLTNQEMEVEL